LKTALPAAVSGRIHDDAHAFAALLAQGAESPVQVFERRILPIFKSPGPSCCLDRHLSGVDLKNYSHPSREKAFLSPRDPGMTDLAKPESSRILSGSAWEGRGPR